MKPFNLEQAAAGERVLRNGYHDDGAVIRGPNPFGQVLIENRITRGWDLVGLRELTMAPITVIDGREVYPDDILYRPDGTEWAATGLEPLPAGLTREKPKKTGKVRLLYLSDQNRIRAYWTYPDDDYDRDNPIKPLRILDDGSIEVELPE